MKLNFISTHTLTWSVTNSHSQIFQFYHISTHTLTWSVTFKLNPLNMRQAISTHTLTWSVTGAISAGLTGVKDFNSHAHVERDYQAKAYERLAINFNSHAHVERDG